MGVKNHGVARFYRGGLVSLSCFFALYVGANEVSAGNYTRTQVPESAWAVEGTVLYLREDFRLLVPSVSLGNVSGLKLMTAPNGGDVLVEWEGSEFSFVDEAGDPVTDALAERGLYVRGGRAGGITITVPLVAE